MKKFSTALLMAVTLMSLNSCRKVIGEGAVFTESRSPGDFTAVEFGVPGELIFIPSDHNEITIEAQQNIINVIETNISGNELKIKVRNGVNIRSSEIIRITVKSATVNSLSINGSGQLSIPQTFKPDNLTLRTNGSGEIRAEDIETGGLNVSISGSGKIGVMNGFASHEDISISGSGNIDLLGLETDSATTQTSGSGAARIFVNQDLDVHISGSGDVYYKGAPAVNTHISGSGNVIRLN